MLKSCRVGSLPHHQRIGQLKDLKKLLEQKKCFKLICGAGNENLEEVEKLVALYAKAGCHFFDLSANTEVLKAAQKGLDFAIPKSEQGDYHFCVSVGIQGEPHLNKAKIDQAKCHECKKCIKACPQEAISKKFKIKEEKCIGCLRCLKACKHAAIEIYQKNKPLGEILPTLLTPHLSPLTCLELHASGEDENDVNERWDYLNQILKAF